MTKSLAKRVGGIAVPKNLAAMDTQQFLDAYEEVVLTHADIVRRQYPGWKTADRQYQSVKETFRRVMESKYFENNLE